MSTHTAKKPVSGKASTAKKKTARTNWYAAQLKGVIAMLASKVGVPVEDVLDEYSNDQLLAYGLAPVTLRKWHQHHMDLARTERKTQLRKLLAGLSKEEIKLLQIPDSVIDLADEEDSRYASFSDFDDEECDDE